MKKFLKKAVLLGAALLAFSPIAELSAATVAAQEEQVLNLAIGSEPPTIDPALATDSTSGAIIKNVFEGLTAMNNEGEVLPAAAESWEVSEDGLTYTFTLRDGNVWSNGDPVTASDFEFAWKRVLNPETASQYASILYVLEGAEAYNSGEGEADAVGVTAVDEKTLEVKLANPTSFFLELTAFYTYMPVHQATVEADANWALDAGDAYVSNGPFSLQEWAHSSHYVLVKSDSYWDAENVALDTVNVQIIEAESTANAEFQAGGIDYLGSPYSTVSLDAIDLYRANEELNVAPYAAIYWYKLNTTDEVTSNVNIRKALALAIDRQGLVDNITKGGQLPALGLVPPTIAGFEDDRDYFADADYDAAKEYLATGLEELGLADASELTINISINTSEAHSTIAQFIQEGWAQNLGINVNIDNTEWQVYLERLNVLDFQVARMGWIADYNDASSFLDMYRTADSGNNDTGWENEEFKSLIDQASAEQDPAVRTDLQLQAEAIMVDEMPVIPLYYYTNLYVVQDHVENMSPDALGNINLKDVSISSGE
ncbi:peptide ABC transporter substrate-binding protein [Aerococcaceae bacterium DSM 109653]|uniref:Peptide ABC transporter substrate-binding protein n=1 Tax=Fundicoccus ignavus TaxID=2664442 RepID=A0A6I2GM67_9LACT|nr:peptide ABC transporter substrate-binding protein [Fundicoccus ignavus]MRI82164.1 peptide ABC transporter substrate-binding protein [Fundicoccus ignavus]MRI85588.1 peptide ABC transporter substrate-binding protein [Fundicoccus ignavus]